ncbi:MAG: response regulator [Pseudomonadales bacterium]|nr:response regulator [Pseudomonadales bacterium]
MLAGHTILAVDDSRAMRALVTMTLERAGCIASVAEDGEQALLAAQEQNFDVIITDINMPVMDGLTLIGELRQLANYKTIPILVFSTEACIDIRRRGMEAGATGWILKPFTPEKLIKALERVID